MKICHLTSVHPRYDTRIFIKECCSLVKLYNTSLVVADGKGNEIINDVNIHDVGKSNGRIERIFSTSKAILRKALEVDADVYHLHDPELIPIGIKLKNQGKKVIFDAHEDLPNQIKSKHYLNEQSKKVLSFLVTNYEKYACSKFDAIVAATPFIRDKFLKINKNSVDINNYPKLEEFELSDNNYQKELQVCYVGGISEVRGINEMVTAIDLADTNVKLVVAGNFVGNNLEAQVKALNGWNKVDFLGYLNREGIKNTISSSIAGLVVLHPTNSYLDSLPVKMFEYMASGVPVIASNFPLWKTIVEETNSGICVNPLDAKEIANAIDFLISNSDVAEKMGNNGKKLVNEKFNWRVEEEKLFKLYKDILGK